MDNAHSEENLVERNGKWNTMGKLTLQKWISLSHWGDFLTSCIANLPFSTWDTVKAAERFSFPVGLSGTWGAALTAHWNRNLNKKPDSYYKRKIWVALTQPLDVTTWLDPVLHWIADSLRWRSNPSTRPIKTSLSDPSGVFCQLTRSYFAGMSAPSKWNISPCGVVTFTLFKCCNSCNHHMLKVEKYMKKIHLQLSTLLRTTQFSYGYDDNDIRFFVYLSGIDVFWRRAGGAVVSRRTVSVRAGEKAVEGMGCSINSQVHIICHSQLRGVSEGMLHSLQGLCPTAGW